MRKICVVLLLACVIGAGSASASEDEYGPDHMMMDDYQARAHSYGMMEDRAMMGRGYQNQGWGACPPMMGQGWRQGGMQMMGRGYMGQGCMMGGAMHGLTKDQYQELLDDTVKLRKKMHMLHFEYREASRNPKTTLQELGDMEQEMLDLRKEMMKKIDSLRTKN